MKGKLSASATNFEPLSMSPNPSPSLTPLTTDRNTADETPPGRRSSNKSPMQSMPLYQLFKQGRRSKHMAVIPQKKSVTKQTEKSRNGDVDSPVLSGRKSSLGKSQRKRTLTQMQSSTNNLMQGLPTGMERNYVNENKITSGAPQSSAHWAANTSLLSQSISNTQII